jgi:hypothetical protein
MVAELLMTKRSFGTDQNLQNVPLVVEDIQPKKRAKAGSKSVGPSGGIRSKSQQQHVETSNNN